jgi:hypothetical protein
VFTQKAENDVDYLSVTVAASVAVGGSGNPIGGAVNVIDMQNHVESVVTGQIYAVGDVNVLALNNSRLLIIPLAIAGGAGSTVAAGVAISVIVTDNVTKVQTADDAVMNSTAGSVIILAQTEEVLMAFTTSGAATSGTVAAGAMIAVLVSNSETEALVNGSTISAKNDVEVMAEGNSWTLTTIIAATASSNAALSGSVAVSIFNRYVGAKVLGDASVTAENGNILV